MTTYLYRRGSSNGQEDGSSLETQRERCAALCTLLGVAEQPVVVTDVVSGSVPLDKRPGGSEMCANLKRGDRIVVAKLDRMFRNAADALTRAEAFKNAGIALHCIDLGVEAVTENGASKLFFGMLALVAEFERSRIRERLAEGQKAKKAKGGHIGGQRPFGYHVEGVGKNASLVPVPEEQAAIVAMRKMRADGASLRKIAEEIQKLGFAISHETVGKVLARIPEAA